MLIRIIQTSEVCKRQWTGNESGFFLWRSVISVLPDTEKE